MFHTHQPKWVLPTFRRYLRWHPDPRGESSATDPLLWEAPTQLLPSIGTPFIPQTNLQSKIRSEGSWLFTKWGGSSNSPLCNPIVTKINRFCGYLSQTKESEHLLELADVFLCFTGDQSQQIYLLKSGSMVLPSGWVQLLQLYLGKMSKATDKLTPLFESPNIQHCVLFSFLH